MKPAIETTPTTLFAKALDAVHRHADSCLVPMRADDGLAIVMLNDPLVNELLASSGTRGRFFPRPVKVGPYFTRGFGDEGNALSLWVKTHEGRDIALAFGLTMRPNGSDVVQFAFQGKPMGATAGQHWQAFADGLQAAEAARQENSLWARLSRLGGRLPAP